LEGEKTYYHRHLPHYQPEFATFHIVYRLAGSLPRHVLEELRHEKELLKLNDNVTNKKCPQPSRLYFERFDALLGETSSGPIWLKEFDIAIIVKDAIHFRDNKLYNLIAYCIMPNHVHMLFELISNTNKNFRVGDSTYMITKILASLKKYTALRANRILKRSGAFWQHESYDHVIRDSDELERTIWYILYNPVKAGLVKHPDNWKWSYCKPEYIS
jgi:REP element-mobilizing transposase RayT